MQCFSAKLVLFGAREAGCFREVAALQYPYRQVSLYLVSMPECNTPASFTQANLACSCQSVTV